jgi:maleamate amidohydrolase
MDDETRRLYEERGLGRRQGAGTRPALVIVDLNYGFTDPESPLYCDTTEAVAANIRLLEAARAAGCPVAFTTLEYDEGGQKVAKAFIDKVPSLLVLAPGSRWSQIDARLAPHPGEPVLMKLFASAFFGTPLSAMLASAHCDTLIVTGASTSGCVRATVVDALQNGYRVVVPREAVADRASGPHDAALFDIDAKYGDVLSTDEAVELLANAEF